MSLIVVPTDYVNIQDALDNANEGDTIKVLKGTYVENISIIKDNITLQGDDDELAVLEGTNVGIGIEVLSNQCIINNFTIQKFSTGLVIEGNNINIIDSKFNNNISNGIIINGNVSILENNVFCENEIGIKIKGENHNILNNSFKKNSLYGISNEDDLLINSSLSYNFITMSEIGILIDNIQSTNNLIENNIIGECDIGMTINGISNNIINNLSSDSKINGIVENGQENTYNSNQLLRNNVGILISGNLVTVIKNIITLSESFAIEIVGDIEITIKDNVVVNNEKTISQEGNIKFFSENIVRDNNDGIQSNECICDKSGIDFTCSSIGLDDICDTCQLFNICDDSNNDDEILQVKEVKSSYSSGSVRAGELVYLTTNTKDATIYYTLDGTEPTTDSKKYNEYIEIPEESTLRTFAIKEGFKDSKVSIYNYTLITAFGIKYNFIYEYLVRFRNPQGVITYVFFNDLDKIPEYEKMGYELLKINKYIEWNQLNTTTFYGNLLVKVYTYGKVYEIEILLDVHSMNQLGVKIIQGLMNTDFQQYWSLQGASTFIMFIPKKSGIDQFIQMSLEAI